MEGRMPIRQGIAAAPCGISKERLRPHALRFSQAATLAELSLSYAFYTPALLYMRVRLMGRDPVAQFVQEYQHEVIPVSMRFNKPIFSGLNLGGDTSWNNVLFGIECEHWDAFVAYMGTMAFLDRGLNLLTRLRTREFCIADPLYFEKAITLPSELPVVPITVFCLDTNQGCAWIEPGAHPLLDLPELRTTAKVFEDTAAFAKALFSEQDNPYKAANSVGPPEAVPRGVGPVRPREPLPIESLPGPQRAALQDLVRQYNQQRNR